MLLATQRIHLSGSVTKRFEISARRRKLSARCPSSKGAKNKLLLQCLGEPRTRLAAASVGNQHEQKVRQGFPVCKIQESAVLSDLGCAAFAVPLPLYRLRCVASAADCAQSQALLSQPQTKIAKATATAPGNTPAAAPAQPGIAMGGRNQLRQLNFHVLGMLRAAPGCPTGAAACDFATQERGCKSGGALGDGMEASGAKYDQSAQCSGTPRLATPAPPPLLPAGAGGFWRKLQAPLSRSAPH